MKKLLTLALALVALTVFTSVGLTQQRVESLPLPKGQAGTYSRAPAAPIILQSTAQVNWPATLGKKQDDLVKSLRGQKLTGQVIGNGANEVIVIYGSDGECRLCLGSGKACKLACPARVGYSDFSVH